MKKSFAVIFSLMLMFISFCASAATYTLPEKMGKQIEVGSGLKGSFTVHYIQFYGKKAFSH